MSQHPARRTRPQQIHMIDMGTTHQHCRHQPQHLTTRVRSTHPTPQPHRPIHQILQPQPIHQRPRHQQTRVGYHPSSSNTTPYRSILCDTPLTGSASQL